MKTLAGSYTSMSSYNEIQHKFRRKTTVDRKIRIRLYSVV